MVVLLALGARRMGEEARFDDRFRKRAGRIVLASVGMGVVLFAATHFYGWTLDIPGWRYLALLILIVVAAVSYLCLGHVLGAFKLSEFKRALRRS